MKSRTARWVTIVAAGACAAAGLISLAPIETSAAAPTTSQAPEEKEACIKNLKAIAEAIQAYQADQKDLPNWLSDLVPQYLPDPNVLICPVCRRTGATEGPPLGDPKIACSYLFEFCPVPLGTTATNAPTRTRREWKRRQMGLVGSAVPVVRCRHHRPVLNLGFDGLIYESGPSWETSFTNRVSAKSLTAPEIFADETPPTRKAPAKPRFPARDAAAGPGLLDLSKYYNATLAESRYGGTGNNLATLPRGLQTFAGVKFDVRGVVQLSGKSAALGKYPAEVKGIKVSQKCQRLYFLHAACLGGAADEGKEIGAYVVHYPINQMRLEIPIAYGREVRNWQSGPNEPTLSKDLTVAWKGTNATSTSSGQAIRLFLTTWTNPAPGVQVESIDYLSRLTVPAPFLVGITAE